MVAQKSGLALLFFLGSACECPNYSPPSCVQPAAEGKGWLRPTPGKSRGRCDPPTCGDQCPAEMRLESKLGVCVPAACPSFRASLRPSDSLGVDGQGCPKLELGSDGGPTDAGVVDAEAEAGVGDYGACACITPFTETRSNSCDMWTTYWGCSAAPQSQSRSDVPPCNGSGHLVTDPRTGCPMIVPTEGWCGQCCLPSDSRCADAGERDSGADSGEAG